MSTTESRATFDALPVGYRLDDYRVVEVLGKGGFGITYKAFDERLERHVAVKEYLPRDYAFRGDQSVVLPRSNEEKQVFEWGLKRFVDEARALALFRHPNIVSVQRFLEANGTAYLVMEYEEGEDLDRWLARRSNVTEAQLVDKILLPILEGLEKVHTKQLLHRDIKPGNIFIRNDGTPVLIDFGASRAHGAQAATNVTSIVSAGYSPFEQYGGGNTRQGPWTDLYALAGTMYRVIAGRPPVDAIARMQGQTLQPAVEVGRGRYSERVLRAIDAALALEAKDRPQSVAAFRASLTGDDPDATRVITPDDATVVRRDPPPVAARKSSRAPLVGVSVAVLLGVAGAGWYFVLGPGKPVPRIAEPAVATTTDRTNEPTEAPAEPTAPAIAPRQDGEERSSTTTPIEAVETVEAGVRIPEPEKIPPEEEILEGLDIPANVQSFRESHIAGTLGGYIVKRDQFEECRRSNCPDQQKLMLEAVAFQKAPWSQPLDCKGDACLYTGTLNVSSPRLLDRPDCRYLVELTEVFRSTEGERSQTRTYCTDNGFNRRVESAGPVTTPQKMG